MRARRKKKRFPVLLLLLVILASSFSLVCVAIQIQTELKVKEEQSQSQSAEEQLPEKTPERLLAEANNQYIESVIQETIQWAQTHGRKSLAKQILAKSSDVIEKKQKLDELKKEMEIARQKAKEEGDFTIPEFEEAKEKWREASAEYSFARNELYNLNFEINKEG